MFGLFAFTKSQTNPSSRISWHELEKLAKEGNHLTFLYKVRQHKVVPKDIIVKLPLTSLRTERISKRRSEAFVRESINDHCLTKNVLQPLHESRREDIEAKTDKVDCNTIKVAVLRTKKLANNRLSNKKQTKRESRMKGK